MFKCDFRFDELNGVHDNKNNIPFRILRTSVITLCNL